MRILHVIASLAPRYGGPSYVCPAMCRALARRGLAVEIFTTNVDGDRPLDVAVETPATTEGVRTTFFAALPWLRSYVVAPGLAAALRRRVAEFDVVHVHNLYLFHSAAAALFARRRSVPYIVTPHGVLDAYHRARHRGRKAAYDRLVGRRDLNRAAGIHYASEAERRHADPLGLQAPSFVVPIGIDASQFGRNENASPFLAANPQLAGGQLVTFMGRLTPKKRVDVLVAAFAEARGQRADARLVIAGPDDEGIGRRARELARSLGVESDVAVTGMLVGDDKVALLRRSSVFVLPSEDESFGISAVEAMAAGTPVVVSEQVAVKDDVQRAEAGLVVERSPHGVAEAILRLLNNPELRVRLGANGRELARTRYDWSEIAKRLEEIYRHASERNVAQ